MHRSRKLMIVGGSILALSAGGVGVAIAVGGDDGDAQATGPGADRARSAALKITGGGTANGVEHGSENGGTWEVEVTKRDGNTVDVRLDENYNLVVVEGDSEVPDDSR
jgi:hypothetical protein